METVDLIILGGGSAGLHAAEVAGSRRMTTAIIDSYPQLGGQLIAIYPEKFVDNVSGFTKILAKDLATHLVARMLNYHPIVYLNEYAAGLEFLTPGMFSVATKSGLAVHGKSVLITAAPGGLTPWKLDLPEAERYEGKGLIYIVTDRSLFKRKRIV